MAPVSERCPVIAQAIGIVVENVATTVADDMQPS
jgi:hypothetical protein